MDAQRDATAKVTKRNTQHIVPVQQDFLFVDASKTAKSSRQGRRNARSFVMQKARREKPWSTSKHAAKQRKSPGSTSPVTETSPNNSNTPLSSTPSPRQYPASGDFSASRNGNGFPMTGQQICADCKVFVCRPGQVFCPKCLPAQPPVPPEGLDNRLFDPFGTSPVEVDSRVSEILDHFVTEMVPRTIAVDIQRQKSTSMRLDWFGTALNNAGFMHSLLCTAALHMYVFGKGSFDSILYHRAQAISAINAALRDPTSSEGISDANIGAVFNLLCVEESLLVPELKNQMSDDDPIDQRVIHLNGLCKMVELRGGLMAINTNRVLQAFILWHSTAHAILKFETPYLTTVDYISTASFPRHPPSYLPKISHHLISYCRTADVKDSLITLVQSVLILIADLNAWFGDPDSPLDPLDIQNYSCVLECLALRWLRDDETIKRPLETALGVALLIVTVRTTEALQHRSDHFLHNVAEKRLQKALSATSRSEWTSCPDLLLWILAVGAISAEGSTASSWFAHQVSLACHEFGIMSADALLGHLHHCGWVSFKLDEAARYLWDRIVNLRLDPMPDYPDDMTGPFQNRVSSPDFADWQNIDWTAFSDQESEYLQIPNQSAGEGSLYDIMMRSAPQQPWINHPNLSYL